VELTIVDSLSAATDTPAEFCGAGALTVALAAEGALA